MQKDVYHDDHQHDGDHQREHDFLHALSHRPGCVERHHIIDVVREAGLHVGHQFLNTIGCLHGIRAWQLICGDDGAGLPIQAPDNAVVLGAQFDASDISEADDSSAWIFANHNLPKLFGRTESSLRADRIGELLAFRRRLASNLSRRIYRVLRLNRSDDFRNGDGQLCQLVRLDPKAHRVLPSAEDLHAADAVKPGNLIGEIDISVV